MEGYSHCPKCDAEWWYKEIPEEHRENYSPPYWYSRVIAYQTWEDDRTLYYICPDCQSKFDFSGKVILDR